MEETLLPGASVARAHDANANQVFHWRRHNHVDTVEHRTELTFAPNGYLVRRKSFPQKCAAEGKVSPQNKMRTSIPSHNRRGSNSSTSHPKCVPVNRRSISSARELRCRVLGEAMIQDENCDSDQREPEQPIGSWVNQECDQWRQYRNRTSQTGKKFRRFFHATLIICRNLLKSNLQFD